MSRYGSITFYTSHIYPIVVTEGVNAAGDMSFIDYLYNLGIAEAVQSGADFLAGAFGSSLFSYTNGLAEGVDVHEDFLAGTLTTSSSIVSYADGLAEGVDVLGSQFIAGSWTVVLIVYSNYPAEGADVSADFIAGQLV